MRTARALTSFIRGALAAIVLVAVGDPHLEAVRIADLEALEVAVIVGDRIESAFLQLALDFLRVPLVDAPRHAVERGVARRARRTALAATPRSAAAGRSRRRICRCGWRRGSHVSTAQNQS